MDDRDKGFIVIQPWMIDLGLTGNELIIFAVINGFSMDGKSKFNGGLQYLCDLTGVSRRTAINCLNKLVDSKLVNKSEYFNPEKNITFSNYSVNKKQCKKCTSEKTALVQELPEGSENFALGVVQELHRGSATFAPIKEIESKEKVNIKGKSRRATRLPADWQPNETELEYIRKKRPDLYPPDVVERFVNYWTAKATDATKLDWSATWRNWVMNEKRAYQSNRQQGMTHEELDAWANGYEEKTIDVKGTESW